MATNKNQHFVPKCYFKPFSINGGKTQIHLYNIDREKFIDSVSVKGQCSRDYFYGKDDRLENALRATEQGYERTVDYICRFEPYLGIDEKQFLARFWLLQHLRTEAASKRAAEMHNGMIDVAGLKDPDFHISIREAVIEGMRSFVEEMDVLDDLKVCLIKNNSGMPYITSDDPAVLTNKLFLTKKDLRLSSFGLGSAGVIALLPLTPNILFVAYDGDVYSIPEKDNGWLSINSPVEVNAFNRHQLLNCYANVYTNDRDAGDTIHDRYLEIRDRRVSVRYKFDVAALESEDAYGARYVSINQEEMSGHERTLIHYQPIYPIPDRWPKDIKWRSKPIGYSNGSSVGLVRKKQAQKAERDDLKKKVLRRGK